MNPAATKFSNTTQLVLQINPVSHIGGVKIEGRVRPRVETVVFVPKDDYGNFIWCPFNYFQEHASLKEIYIKDDGNNKMTLEYVDNLEEVIVTKVENGHETEISLSADHKRKLLEYLKFDIQHFTRAFQGFDCYAFVSLLSDVKVSPSNPEFNYESREASIGDIIVLAKTKDLPNSIQHWALYLGADCFLSKFGKSDGTASSLLEVMNLDGMKYLYEAPYSFVATPQVGARKWDGFYAQAGLA
ncbi:MAG: hypothetical protein IPL32_03995 [Chloracidobacterium sp.]|nr:hypothetical protein [Chloracidobacterium sp.]